MAGLLLGAGASLRGADPASPPSLEEIKGDLKVIKHGTNTELNDLATGAKAALPQFTPAPDASAPPAAPPTAARTAPGKKPGSANWLLDAMAAQAKARPGGRTEGVAGREADKPLLDATDPAFMLKLYLAQEAGEAVPERNRRPAEALRGAAGDVGSFDRFLGQWMSPRDLSLLGLGEAAGPASAGPKSGAGLIPFGAPAPEPSAIRAPNPYLEAMKLDLAPPPAAIDLGAPGAPELPLPAVVPPPAPLPAPLPAIAPPPAADDQKYFPQLKRF